MTNWTEVNDVSTSWGQGDYPVDSLITEGNEEFLTEDSEIIATEGIQINWGETEEIWTDTADIATVYTKISDL